jgi:hypothetical protein
MRLRKCTRDNMRQAQKVLHLPPGSLSKQNAGPEYLRLCLRLYLRLYRVVCSCRHSSALAHQSLSSTEYKLTFCLYLFMKRSRESPSSNR